ncbi:hypothetical protein C8R45DRAFT_1115710 [Mycena sanguinolenta]|nr:hypothetical protein C8R45DRAFT_1115710 [Mycena sanguinolenta]
MSDHSPAAHSLHGSENDDHSAPDDDAEPSANQDQNDQGQSGWCKKCGHDVPAWQSHGRRIHQMSTTLTFFHPSISTVSINRDTVTKKFHCPRCNMSSNADPRTVNKHAKNCGKKPDAVAKPLDPHLPSPSTTARVNPALIGRTDLFVPPPIPPSLLLNAEDAIEPTEASQLNPQQGALTIEDPPSIDSTDITDWLNRGPDVNTVVFHPKFNLPSFDIVINTLYHIVICLSCEVAIEPSTIESHVRGHWSALHVTPGMGPALIKEFDLCPLSQVVVPHPPPAPIFGLALTSDIYWFCDRCHRGYSTREILRSHQNTKDLCPRAPDERNTWKTGLAQIFTLGGSKRYFRVDIRLPNSVNASADATLQIFHSTRPPAFNYSKIMSGKPRREQDTNTFLKREGWLSHIEGYEGSELAESCRMSTPADDPLHKLAKLVIGYISRIQPEIIHQAGFGMQKLLADVGVSTNLTATFNTINKDSCENYGRYLWKLVYNLLRQIDDDEDIHAPYIYPLTAHQTACLKELASLTRRDLPREEQELICHRAIHSLFSHKKQDNRGSKYFNAVICFSVITSFKPSLELHRAGQISSNFMKLVYANRTSQLLEIRHLLDADPTLTFNEAYAKVKPYLIDSMETPMSHLFNTYNLLKLIRSEEAIDEQGEWLDVEGTMLHYQNSTIHVHKFKDIYLEFWNGYKKILAEEVFMGYEPPTFVSPSDLDPVFMYEDLQERAPGHCFLDNSRNPSHQWGDLFIEWLLSIDELREEFSYVHEGKLVWRPEPTLRLLRAIDRANDQLVGACIIGSGACARGTELAGENLRNSPGSSLRNALLLYNTFCFTSILDKMSNKTYQDRFTPAALPKKLTPDVIFNLGVIRPTQVYLVNQFFDADEARRFHESLHPRLNRNLTSEALSKILGDITEKHLDGARLTITPLRKVESTIMQKHGDPRGYEMAKNFHCDLVGNHNTATSNAVYQQASGSVTGVSRQRITGCILHSIGWQRVTGIDEGDPLSISSLGNDDLGLPDSENLMENPALQVQPQQSAAVLKQEFNKVLPEFLGSIKKTIDSKLMESNAQAQALYFPLPIPTYANYELRDVSNIQPHPSRRRELSEALHNPNFDFTCPEQAIALEKLLQRKHHLFLAITCGFGKTAVALYAAKLLAKEALQCVIIVPHSGLHLELIRRCNEMQLTHAKWEPTEDFDTHASVIWAAIEHVAFQSFKTFVKRMTRQHRLSHIYFDEAHKLLTDIHYRESFKHVPTLGQYGAPFIPMTGSMPPGLMDDFRRLSGIQDWDIIRMGVSRGNLIPAVFYYKTEEQLIAAVVHHVEACLKEYTDEERLMVFTRSVKQAKDYGQRLGVQAFYSELDMEIRAQTLHKFRSGVDKLMVSTPLMGSGTDYKHVRDILNVHKPHNPFDGLQQDNRGGRDYKWARVTTFLLENEPSFPPEPDRIPIGEPEMSAWLKNKTQCRRLGPSMFFDGRPITCVLLGGLFCDICEDQEKEQAPEAPLPMPVDTTSRDVIPKSSRNMPPPSTIPSRATPIVAPQPRQATSNFSNVRKNAAPPQHRDQQFPSTQQFDDRTPTQSAGRPSSVSRTESIASEPSRQTISVVPRPYVVPFSIWPSLKEFPEFRLKAVPILALISPKCSTPLHRRNPDRSLEVVQHTEMLAGLRQQPLPILDRPPRQADNPLVQPRERNVSQSSTRRGRSPLKREVDSYDILAYEAEDARERQRSQAPQAIDDHLPVAPRNPKAKVTKPKPATGSSHRHSGPSPTAGLTVEQQKAQNAIRELKLNEARDVFRSAFERLKGYCPPCWARGFRFTHDHLTCDIGVGNDMDPDWQTWHRKAFEFPVGYCYQCLIPQNKLNGGWHVRLDNNRDCLDKNRFKPAIYALVTADSADGLHIQDYPMLPADVFPSGINEDLRTFREWCAQEVPDLHPLLNVHLLLLWLIFKRGLVECPEALRFVLQPRRA